MKKIVMLSAIVFAFVMTANMAFAQGTSHHRDQRTPAAVSLITATVDVNSSANTGNNVISSYPAPRVERSRCCQVQTSCACPENKIDTYNATSTVTGAGTGVMVDENGLAMVTARTRVNSRANTGGNTIYSNTGGSNTIVTGNATSNVSLVASLVVVE